MSDSLHGASWSDAKKRNKTFYRSHVACNACGAPTPLRVTHTKRCVICLSAGVTDQHYSNNRNNQEYMARRAENNRLRRSMQKDAVHNPVLTLYLRSFQAIETNARKDKTMRACEHKANAKKAGRKTYLAPYDCEVCGTGKRYTVSGNCVECAKAHNAAYSKSEVGQEKNRERQARFRARQAAKKMALIDDI